jgi:mannitol-specific phosphotransferase system IIBC component
MKLGPILLICCCCCNISLIIGVIIYMQQNAANAKKKEAEQKEADRKQQMQKTQVQVKDVEAKATAEIKPEVTEKPKEVKKIVHRRTNKCVDSDGNNVYGGSCGSDYQKWTYENGIFKHMQSNKCLSFNNNEQKVIISDCNENDRFQKWTQNETLIKNNVTGRCLDGDGEKIYAGYCDTNNRFQQWDVLNF